MVSSLHGDNIFALPGSENKFSGVSNDGGLLEEGDIFEGNSDLVFKLVSEFSQTTSEDESNFRLEANFAEAELGGLFSLLIGTN